MIKNKIAFVFAFVFLLASVSAVLDFRDYPGKWNLCNALNLTQASCDTYWENISNFGTAINQSFNATEQGYVNGVLNGTYTLNQTINQSLIDNWNQTHNGTYILNVTNTTNTSLDSCTTKECVRDIVQAYCPNTTIGQTINATPYQQPVQQTSDNTGLWIVIVIMFSLVIIAGFYFTKKKPTPNDYPANQSQYSGDPQTPSSEFQALGKLFDWQEKKMKETIEKAKQPKEKAKGKSKKVPEKEPEEETEEEE